MTVSDPRSLLSAHKSSDGLQVLLHPLVLLTISDFITRHTLRRQQGPIVGALLGQQNGREVSLEHAFECRLAPPSEQGEVLIDQTWFEIRLQQFKLVLKVPPLELVGWFTLAPASGPLPAQLPIHRQILHTYNESAVLLTFHPSFAAEGSTTGGKLPLTIYESVYEAETTGNAAKSSEDRDKQMDVEIEAGQMTLRFRELPYTIDTGEAEMISVDFVARGGGNATAVDGTVKPGAKSAGASDPGGKGKLRDASSQNGAVQATDDSTPLSPEDEELIASLTARVNAIKMLHARIQLLRSYLAHLPPSYLTRADRTVSDADSDSAPDPNRTEINHPILRSIQALVNRLPLLIPSETGAFQDEMLAEKNDVSLVALLGTMSKSVKDVREVGRKFSIVDSQRQSRRQAPSATDIMSDDITLANFTGNVWIP